MQAIFGPIITTNETGSLWQWVKPVPAHGNRQRPFSLFMEAKPLLVRLAILVGVTLFATVAPRQPVASPTDATRPLEMAQLIVVPVKIDDQGLTTGAVRTGRHPDEELHFTRFSNSWFDFQY